MSTSISNSEGLKLYGDDPIGPIGHNYLIMSC